MSGNIDWQLELPLSDVPLELDTGVGISFDDDLYGTVGCRAASIALGMADVDVIIKES